MDYVIGDKYDGDWKEDMREGAGIYTKYVRDTLLC